MKYKTTTIASVLGITAAGFISVWVCDRFVKRRKQTKKMSIVFNDVVNDTETAILLQTAISQKRTRTRITSGMIRKWNMMAKKGMSHKQIAAEYGVSLVSVDRHLARSGILFNTDHVPAEDARTWASLWNLKYENKILMR